MGGRRAAPTAALQTRGKRSQRHAAKREELHVGTALGDPPKKLSESAQAIWREVAAESPPGLLTGSDRKQVEIVCILMAQQRETKHRFSKYRDLMNALDRLGMTPSGRAAMATKKGTGGGGGGGAGGASPNPNPPPRSGFGALRGGDDE